MKVKSLTTDEISLNEQLAAAGIDVLETDLAELICQLAGESSSHILVPAIHKNRVEIRDLFREKLGRPDLSDEPRELAEAARLHLRERFLRAKVAISGANFAVAETGTVCIVESEGNGRFCTTLPDTLITVVGIEKLVPAPEDLEVFLQLLPRSSTGERMNPYTSLWTGVTPGDGPQAFHVVLLDAGRTDVLADEVGRQTLACIRCSACLNVCPVYERTGGHAYESVYPGPIGAILTPQLQGVGQAASLPYASSLCGACYEVCPVKIDIPQVLIHLRGRVVAETPQPRFERLSMRVLAWALRKRAALRARPAPRPARRPSSCAGRSHPTSARTRRLDGDPRPAAGRVTDVPGVVEIAMTARDVVLTRVRHALADVPSAEGPERSKCRERTPSTSRPARWSASSSASPTTGPV